MNYAIITGASSGLGKEIGKKLILERYNIVNISRNKPDDLIELSKKYNVNFTQINFDLTKIEELERISDSIFSKLNFNNAKSILFINNAGSLSPIKPIDTANTFEIINHISINLTTPIVLSSMFLKVVEKINCSKLIINISSGASKNPYAGWSCYCSTKASLNMFTKCTALEQNTKKYPTNIISFIPGIFESNMQNQIRNTSVDKFPMVDKFINLKKDGLVNSPEFVATKLMSIIQKSTITNGDIIDIKNLM